MEGHNVPRPVCIRRYIVDLAVLRTFSKENEDHWAKLLEETGKPVFQAVHNLWTERFGGEQETFQTEQIAKALRFVLCVFDSRVRFSEPSSPAQSSLISETGPAVLSSAQRSETVRIPSQPTSGTLSSLSLRQHLTSTSALPPTIMTTSLHAAMPPSHPNPLSLTSHHQPPPGPTVGTQPPSMEHLLLQTANTLKGLTDKVDKISHGQQDSSHSGLKMPAVELFKYDGNPFTFMEWSTRYKALVHHRKLSDEAKLILLEQHIKPEAQKKCWGQGLDALTYEQAWNDVLSTFANKATLSSLYIDRMTAQPMPKNEHDITGIRELVNTTRKMINCLGRMEVHPMEYSRTTMIKFKERVPVNLLMKMVEQTHTKISEMKLSDFIAALDSYCSVREDVSTFLQYKTSPQSNPSTSGSGAGHSTTMVGRTTQQSSSPVVKYWQRKDPVKGYPKCIFCQVEGKNGHKWKDCTIVTDPKQRLRKFWELKLCTCCGSTAHKWQECKSRRTCYANQCNGSHHVSLHEYFNNPSSGNPRPIRGNPSQPRQQQQASGNGNNTQGNVVPPPTTTACASSNEKKVILGVLQGDLSYPGKPKRSAKGNVFLDNGSDTSYITRECATKLGLPVLAHKHTSVDSFGGSTENLYPVTQVRVAGRHGQALLTCLIADKILSKPFQIKEWKEAARKAFPHWSFPQLDENDSFKVDILVGMDHINDIRGDRIEKAGKLEARNSILGHYLEGNYKDQHNEEAISATFSLKTTPTINYTYSKMDEGTVTGFDFEEAESSLQKFFAEEDFSAAEDRDPTKDELLKKFMEGTRLIDTPSGRAYEVPFLWKSEESKEKLQPNFNQSLAFMHRLRDRLKEKGTLEACNKVIESAIDAGYYEVVETNPTKGHHIPTFFVEQPNSTSTPVRHVIAANLGTPPLNSELEIGTNLLSDLPTLLRRMRVHKTGLTADISKAYHQLVVREEDRDYLKILWIMGGQLVTLRLVRIPFGTCLAPFQLFATLFKHLTTHNHPDAKALNDVLYNDNVVVSVKENELDFALNAVAILGDGGFTLRKFSTNSPSLQKELEARNLLNMAEREHTRVLGMKWALGTDLLSFCRPLQPGANDVVTRRSILHQLPRHFDPIGILSPVLMPGVNFISQMCDKNYEWDDPLSEEDATQWKNLYAEVQKAVADFKGIPRHHDLDPEKPIRLHVFSDASTSWGGVSAYLTQEGKAALVAAKAKLPAKRLRTSGITVPRRELEALVLGAKMLSKLQDTYKPLYADVEPHLWSDSQIALNWASNDSKVNAFVDNRVRLLRDLIPGVPLHYIDTADNPSDPVSRGMTAEEYLNPNHLYWTGPNQMHEQFLPPFKPEKQTEIVTLATSAEPAPSILNLVNIAESETLGDVKRRLAAVIMCARKWRKQEPLNPRALAKYVTAEIVKAEQKATIGDVVKYLTTKEGPRPACVQPLSLFMKEGIVRVGGRLGRANLPYSHRYPIYMSRDSPLLPLRVLECHKIALHSGYGVTRAKLQREYWVPRSSRTIRRIVKTCYRCRRASGPPFRWPESPDLPEERVDPATPYNTIGCDLTGHFLVRTQQGTEKVYVALFSDTATRHINLEVLDNMETTSFLSALRRHSATHGTPTKIISDRATYFVKSSAILGEKLGEEFCNAVAKNLSRQGIFWQFNPAASPHMGGHFERLIGLVKSIMKRTIGRSLMEKTEFVTLTKEAACVANSRILGIDNPSSHRDRLPITPNHLVYGREISPLPYGEGNLDEEEDPSYDLLEDEVIKHWRRLASRLSAFREQFSEEYLQHLRTKHHADHHSDPMEVPKIKKGDLVLMKHEELKRSLWDMAIVLEILPSSDGKTRAVRLRTKNGECTRPIIKLYPLLTAEQLEGKEHGQDQELEQEDQPTAAPTNQPATDIQTPPATPTPPASTPRTRPQRAAKTAARTWLQGVTNDLLDD